MSYTSPNWNTSVLITIDTQNDFTLTNAPAQISGTMEILPKMKSLLEKYREIGLPIIHVIRLYKEDGSNVDICRKEAVEKGARIVAPYSDGAELVSEIHPLSYSSLDAHKLLNGEFQSVGDCPRTSMYEASERDFRVVMVADCMSQVYEKGIQEMSNIGVHVCVLNDVLSAI